MVNNFYEVTGELLFDKINYDIVGKKLLNLRLEFILSF